MSFQYSSSSGGLGNRVVGFQGDRPRHGIVRWAESQECSSGGDGRRRARFGDHLMINKKDCEGDLCREFGQACGIQEAATSGGGRPPSPSPICSPSNSISPASSPTHDDGGRSCPLNEESDSITEGLTVARYRGDYLGKRPLGESQSIEKPAPSPSRSDDGSISRLANIYTSRHSKPENPEDGSNDEGVREIYITEERSRSAANISNHMFQNGRGPRQANWSDTSLGSYISSDAESISLSTEFNNVLAAAAAAGTNSSAAETERLRSILEEGTPPRTRSRLPGIGEEEPARTTNADEADQAEPYNENNSNYRRDEMALVVSAEGNANTAPGAQPGNRDQRGGRDYLALVPMSGTHESGSNSDRDAPLSSWDTQNNERAMAAHGESENTGGSYGSAPSSAKKLKDVPTPKQLALAKVKRDKIEAKAVAWEEARTAEVDNRFKREESVILAWENEQKVKASIQMKTVERKLEEKRAKAYEQMQNKIVRAHQKAEERRAIAEARKGAQMAKIAEAVDKIRYLGRLPRKFLLF